MRARVSTAVAAKNMARRADRLLAELEPVRQTERVARIRLPEPARADARRSARSP